MCREAALRARVLSYVLIVTMVVAPTPYRAQSAIDPSTYSNLIDTLRDAEKMARSSEVRDAIRSARRALDRAQEFAENSRAADAGKEVDAARAALSAVSAALASESDGVRAAVTKVQQGTGGSVDQVTVSKAAVETADGLHVATFDTLQGTVTVNLPDDLAAGDTISGTVVTDPKGQSPEQKAQNQDSLSGVVVEVAQQQTPASTGRGKWIVPAAAAAIIPLVLRDRSGREIGKVNVPVAKVPAQKPAEAFQVPAIGQTGKPLAIAGSFDGDFETSAVRVAGQAVDVLAESPRRVIARSPVDTTGTTQIEIEEKGVVQKCEYRNVAVKLSAPILDLKSGQTTTMTITVEGLAGLDQAFPVSVINRSPSVVRIAQGDRQTFQVEPSKATGGRFVATRTLTGVTPGGFNISATIPPGTIPPRSCSVTVWRGGEHPVASAGASPERPTTSVGALNPDDVSRVEPPPPPEPPDDPETLRNATVAVHTGLEWRALADGRRIVTFRDNPPMTGVIDLTPGWAYSPPLGALEDTRATWWRTFSRYQAWANSDHKFAGSAIRTFSDANNRGGELGIAAAGNLPGESSAARRVRFHSNGLLLQPGTPVPISLQRRALGAAWRSVGNANGTVELDGNTVLVPVALVLVRETSIPVPVIDLELAQLWFDGRTVNRMQVTSSETRSSLLLLDRDPHPAWTVDRIAEPGSSRLLTSTLAQDPDQVWSQCGRFGRSVQFRLVRFGTVEASSAGDQCRNVSGSGAAPPSTLEYCVGGWGEALKRATGNTTPAITIAISADYTTARGVAQAWRTGILIGWRAVGSQTTDQSRTVAHEIGHVLGYGNALFNDGAGGPGNLMAGGGPTLTREQCEIAHAGARSIAGGR